ncbi:sugar ABC transporter ATP-binding protein [Arsenicitalea aurantiaca]|uniref:Sugar ABC transporter ATP-binding protein n=1 Tax=Arsenicitalea aurantiaca TaxID=1783274 RepID=A0A433XLB1_9HYPH|nr:sugar ABC transporter ATP-binding protein [Arsenicitalea aurantiaca]RUT34869.1 sugar ABC transporter ATP-binding protein [Arsenicitalea aurantiaca]
MAQRLSMRNIGKAFGGVPVLSDVELTLEPGEVVALLGSNGAGKSTLVKILTGLYTRDGGVVEVDGSPVVFSRPADAIAAGVKLLPQEISVMPDMTVAENILLGELPTKTIFGFRQVDDEAMRRRASELLAQLGFRDLDVTQPVKRLSVAEQRIVEIARAIAGQARILIMDEPTAALTEQEAHLLFAIIRRLKAQQVSVVYISHYMSEVFEISDRIVVLRDGRNSGNFATAATDKTQVLAAMLGETAGDLYPDTPPPPAGAEILTVDNLVVRDEIAGVSFSVRAGEILGIFGLVGSGVEVLGRALYGAVGSVRAGTVTLDGKPYRPSNPQAGKRAGIGFVAAERKKEGIIADLTVRENIALPFQSRFTRGLFVARDLETGHAGNWIRDLSIRTRGPEQKLRTLSGGNQQKVCLARWLVDGVHLLILEEPTRGVDIGARREIYGKLRELTGNGFAVIILSSDVEEVAGISDRSLVLDRGRIVQHFEKGATPAQLMAATAETVTPAA